MLNKSIVKLRGRFSLAKRISVFVLILLLPTILLSQVNGTDLGSVLISGQVTNIVNGAPVTNQEIIIESDPFHNPSFIYNKVVTTDEWGFYYDTINTNADKGALVFTTYDENNVQYKNTGFFRFNNPKEYVLANFKIEDSGSLNNFQASFYTEKDTTNPHPYAIQFFDNSYGDDIRTWRWDITIDSVTTETFHEQNPTYEFQQEGIYEVILTVSNKGSGNDYFYSSVIIQQVAVGLNDGIIHLGGHIKIGQFPIEDAVAFLYTYNEYNELIAYDTALIDPAANYYWFYNIPPGKYITKAVPTENSIFYGDYIPTYFGDVITWTSATVMDLTESFFDADINPAPIKSSSIGNGFIQGNINYGGSSDNGYGPASDINILLFDQQNDCAHYIYSDENGIFSFSDLPYGTYKVHAEVPGKLSNPVTITLDANNFNIDDLLFIILNDQVISSIEDHLSAYIENIGEVYPNPAKEQAYINLDMKTSSNVKISVLNYLGQIIDQSNNSLESGLSRLSINTSFYPEGYYQIIIFTEDDVTIKRKLLKVK